MMITLIEEGYHTKRRSIIAMKVLIRYSTSKSIGQIKLKILNAKVVADEEKMNANLRRKIVYYMDNATIHCNKVNVAYYQEHGIEVIFGIPYTPEFNVAEYFFTDMKKLYYKTCFKSK